MSEWTVDPKRKDVASQASCDTPRLKRTWRRSPHRIRSLTGTPV